MVNKSVPTGWRPRAVRRHEYPLEGYGLGCLFRMAHVAWIQ